MYLLSEYTKRKEKSAGEWVPQTSNYSPFEEKTSAGLLVEQGCMSWNHEIAEIIASYKNKMHKH
jgi:hypothetical protein